MENMLLTSRTERAHHLLLAAFHTSIKVLLPNTAQSDWRHAAGPVCQSGAVNVPTLLSHSVPLLRCAVEGEGPKEQNLWNAPSLWSDSHDVYTEENLSKTNSLNSSIHFLILYPCILFKCAVLFSFICVSFFLARKKTRSFMTWWVIMTAENHEKLKNLSPYNFRHRQNAVQSPHNQVCRLPEVLTEVHFHATKFQNDKLPCRLKVQDIGTQATEPTLRITK